MNKFYDTILKLLEYIKLREILVEVRRNYFKKRILNYYKNTNDPEIKEIIDVIKRTNQLNVFNYDFCDKYRQMNVEVQYDSEADMYYVLRNGRRLYFKRGMFPDTIEEYYKGICAEQDVDSPHNYLFKHKIRKGDIILDLGGAEGNFVFNNLDKISKAIIVECEEAWIKALEMTFKDSTNVIIVNRMIANKTDENNISLDDLVKQYSDGVVDFVKMDIEGMEPDALQGGNEILSKGTKLAICTYHNNDDYEKIASVLKENDYNIT